MAGRSRYSPADKAKVLLQLHVNEGIVERTAKDTGVPAATVRDWKQRWEKNGVPDEVMQEADHVTDTFVEDAVRVRNKALTRMEELLPKAQSPEKLVAVVGMLDDKINRARGVKPRNTEQAQALPSPQEMRALLMGWVTGALHSAHERERDIIEVELEQLPKGDDS